jgi:phospholipid transport system substrate-binding protein
MLINSLKLIFTLLFLSFSFSSLHADELPKPQALVKNASENMIQALKDNKEALAANPDLIYELVEKILMPNFDFEKMSKLALGKNWRQASKTQRTEFIEQFRLLLIRTYSTAMKEYSDHQITVLPLTDDLSKKKVKVDTEVAQTGGPSIPMSFSMYQNKSDDWKVYDVKIDGISLVTNYRSTFATEIRNKGMDKLIADLAERSKKVTQ